jgi:ACR3 family arsenite transporter
LERQTLERRQVWIYLFAILGGLLVGSADRRWPILRGAALADADGAALRDLRAGAAAASARSLPRSSVVAAVLTGNFIVLPAVAWMLVQWLPPDPALRLGVLLVLLVPCTDWFITFSQLGGGNVPRAIAVTPINLLLQLLLPLYLWLMLGADLSAALTPADVRPALAGLLPS